MNLLCIQIEGPKLMQHGFRDAIAKVGLVKFLSDLFWIGMFYHLYNQVWAHFTISDCRFSFLFPQKLTLLNYGLSWEMQLATNTLERVAPLTHAVGNVLKRVFVIGFSIVVFGE